MPKVSIIIPVYGASATIVRCLDSVLEQTLDDVECVLVDDHGPDESIALAKAHLAVYDGKKSFAFTETPINSGPGVARNCGITAASGKYVAFLDADDTLDPSFCQSLWDAAKTSDADIAFCHISLDHPDGTCESRSNPLVTDGPFEGAAKRNYLRRFKSFFTTYLYRRSLLLENDIRFPGTHSAEDSCFLICSLLCAKRIACVDQALYHYALQPGSVSQKRDPARWKNRLASFGTMKAFAKTHGLYRPYRGVILFMILKKGWLLAAKDFLTNNL